MMGDDAGLIRPCWDCKRQLLSWNDGKLKIVKRAMRVVDKYVELNGGLTVAKSGVGPRRALEWIVGLGVKVKGVMV